MPSGSLESLKMDLSPIGSLPDEMLLKIFDFLPVKDLALIGEASHRFHRIAGDDRLWSQQLGHILGESLSQIEGSRARYAQLISNLSGRRDAPLASIGEVPANAKVHIISTADGSVIATSNMTTFSMWPLSSSTPWKIDLQCNGQGWDAHHFNPIPITVSGYARPLPLLRSRNGIRLLSLDGEALFSYPTNRTLAAIHQLVDGSIVLLCRDGYIEVGRASSLKWEKEWSEQTSAVDPFHVMAETKMFGTLYSSVSASTKPQFLVVETPGRPDLRLSLFAKDEAGWGRQQEIRITLPLSRLKALTDPLLSYKVSSFEWQGEVYALVDFEEVISIYPLSSKAPDPKWSFELKKEAPLSDVYPFPYGDALLLNLVHGDCVTRLRLLNGSEPILLSESRAPSKTTSSSLVGYYRGSGGVGEIRRSASQLLVTQLSGTPLSTSHPLPFAWQIEIKGWIALCISLSLYLASARGDPYRANARVAYLGIGGSLGALALWNPDREVSWCARACYALSLTAIGLAGLALLRSPIPMGRLRKAGYTGATLSLSYAIWATLGPLCPQSSKTRQRNKRLKRPTSWWASWWSC